MKNVVFLVNGLTDFDEKMCYVGRWDSFRKKLEVMFYSDTQHFFMNIPSDILFNIYFFQIVCSGATLFKKIKIALGRLFNYVPFLYTVLAGYFF